VSNCDILYHKEPPNGFVRGDCELELNHKGACKYVSKRKDKKETPQPRVMTQSEVEGLGLDGYIPQPSGPIPPGMSGPVHPNAERARLGLADIVSPDAPRTTNAAGGSQSHIPVRFDLIDGGELFSMAAVLHEGAEKYGADNWRKIDINDHLNHLIMHAYAYLDGDRTDEHLSHIMCRSMFAQGVALAKEKDG